MAGEPHRGGSRAEQRSDSHDARVVPPPRPAYGRSISRAGQAAWRSMGGPASATETVESMRVRGRQRYPDLEAPMKPKLGRLGATHQGRGKAGMAPAQGPAAGGGWLGWLAGCSRNLAAARVPVVPVVPVVPRRVTSSANTSRGRPVREQSLTPHAFALRPALPAGGTRESPRPRCQCRAGRAPHSDV